MFDSVTTSKQRTQLPDFAQRFFMFVSGVVLPALTAWKTMNFLPISVPLNNRSDMSLNKAIVTHSSVQLQLAGSNCLPRRTHTHTPFRRTMIDFANVRSVKINEKIEKRYVQSNAIEFGSRWYCRVHLMMWKDVRAIDGLNRTGVELYTFHQYWLCRRSDVKCERCASISNASIFCASTPKMRVSRHKLACHDVIGENNPLEIILWRLELWNAYQMQVCNSNASVQNPFIRHQNIPPELPVASVLGVCVLLSDMVWAISQRCLLNSSEG